MDFDEYDYLEKAVEKPEPQKSKEVVNGGEGTVKSEERDRNRSSKHRSDRNDDDSDRRSKRTKSDGESRSLDKDRSSSRHLSSLKDRERSERDRHRSNREHNRDKERDREERNGKERSGGRDRDRERDHDKEKREGGHEHDRERDRDKNIELSRRSRSHSERRRDERDREKSQEREKSQDKEYKNRERATELTERDRGSRRYKEKKEDKVEPEADPERDQRTVFAYQISLKADEKDVYEFFSRAGKVRDVRLIMDRNSRRSKGVGYIEFYDSMAVPMAIALSGQPLLGQPVMVKPSEAEKNLVQSTASALGGGGHAGPYSGGGRRLYVGNLHLNITEDQLRQVFEAFGAVELVQLPIDLMTGFSKGFGFVQFARLEDAVAAQSLNGQLDIAGRTIKVSAITDQAAMLDAGVNTADFDDDESGGLSLNAQSRALLMQKLDRSGTTPSVAGSLATTMVNSPGLPQPGSALPGLATLAGGGLPMPALTVPSVDTVGVPSECFLLKNMFDPSLETEPDFDLDIKEDVEAECSKFGALKHIYVDKNSAGFVYLRFEDTQAAVGAQRALHGRWFAGKMITATFMVPQTYEAKFPDSR